MLRFQAKFLYSAVPVLQCYSIARAREPTCVQAWEAMGSLEASSTSGQLPSSLVLYIYHGVKHTKLIWPGFDGSIRLSGCVSIPCRCSSVCSVQLTRTLMHPLLGGLQSHQICCPAITS